MNKLEIERAIAEECKELLLELKMNNEKFDGKGIGKFQKRLWQIADKYGTDGANVFNIMITGTRASLMITGTRASHLS